MVISRVKAIDVKSSKGANFHDALITFIVTRQGQAEPNNDDIKRFNSNYQILKLAGGNHGLCSEKIIDKLGTTATDDEKKVEIENMKDLCLLKQSDESGY